MASSELTRSSSTKIHQAPAQTPLIVEPGLAGQVSEQVARIERRLSQKQDKSDTIASWISDQSQALPIPNLPLTPPALSVGSNSNRSSLNPPAAEEIGEEEEEEGQTKNSAIPQPGTATPNNQRSPPTPDQTPPKPGLLHSKTLRLGTPGSRKPSSASGSFRTAQEGISVDYLPESDQSFHTADHTQEQPQTSKGKAPVGLGLGFDSPDGSRTPTMHSPRIVGENATADTWIDHDNGVYDDPFTAPESMAVQEVDRERGLGKHLLLPTEQTTPTRQVPQDFQASFERDTPEQPHTPTGPQPSTPTVQQDSSPSTEQASRPTSNDSDFIHVDKKRLSSLSTQSQVVQAIVLSTPRQRRQRLRHSSKNTSLRTASSPIPSSNRSSLVSAESKPRALHRTPKLGDWGNRVSLNSDSGVSMGSDMRNKVDDAVPFHEIPAGLRSSLRRSSEKQRTLSRKFSDLARRESERRPATAPEGESGSEAVRSTRRRSNSAASAQPLSSQRRGRRTIDYRPEIPPRTSSLSAHTSQHNSRATSLTSTSLHKHSGQQPNQQAPTQMAQRESPARDRQTNQQTVKPEIRIGGVPAQDEEGQADYDEAQGGQRRSMLETPFSGVSLPASTPGPIELNEATTVNIYPHSNTSVLVVQQLAQQGSDRPRLLTSHSGNVSIKVDEHGRSKLSQPSQRYEPLTEQQRSLLHYQAPAVMLIPPTPALTTPVAVQQSRSSSKRYPPPSGKLSMMRRAVSARRYSESLIGPLTRPLVVRRESALRSEQSPKLSPFWRPKAFWNDVPGGDDDENEPPDWYVRNTLGLPQRRLIAGPGSLSRRIGSLRRRKQQQSAEMSMDDFDGAERRVGILSRLKNTRIIPFASLAEAIEKLRTRRAETLIEKQRDRLRKHIGPPIPVQGNDYNM